MPPSDAFPNDPPTRSAAQLLLRMCDDTSQTAGRTLIERAAAAAAGNAHSLGSSVTVFEPIPGATRGTAHAELMGETPYDVLVEWTFSTDVPPAGQEVEELLSSYVASVGDVADHERSGVLIGTEFAFVAGDGAIRLQVFVARLGARNAADFADHWLHRHGALIRPTRTGAPYRQFHADVSASDAAAAAIGFGSCGLAGAAIAGYDTVDAYRAALSNVDRMAPIIEDERLFIDHTRSAVGLYRPLPAAN